MGSRSQIVVLVAVANTDGEFPTTTVALPGRVLWTSLATFLSLHVYTINAARCQRLFL